MMMHGRGALASGFASPPTVQEVPFETMENIPSQAQLRQLSHQELEQSNDELRNEIAGLRAELHRRRSELNAWNAAAGASAGGVTSTA